MALPAGSTVFAEDGSSPVTVISAGANCLNGQVVGNTNTVTNSGKALRGRMNLSVTGASAAPTAGTVVWIKLVKAGQTAGSGFNSTPANNSTGASNHTACPPIGAFVMTDTSGAQTAPEIDVELPAFTGAMGFVAVNQSGVTLNGLTVTFQPYSFGVVG